MISTVRYLAFLPTILLCFFIFAGCEEDVVMVVGTERDYSLYGVLNPHSDTQFVHVFPIDATLDEADSVSQNARFTSTDQQTGEVVEWKEMIVGDTLGQFHSVYYAPFSVQYDHSYALDITGPEGRNSQVEVKVPTSLKARLGDATYQSAVICPLVLTGDATHFFKVRVTFTVQTLLAVNFGAATYKTIEVTVPYDKRVVKTSTGWSVPVDLKDAYKTAYVQMNELEPVKLSQNGLELLLIDVDLIVANEEWDPPGDTFDDAALVFPEAMTNVRNGFGFVGAGYRVQQAWLPFPYDILRAAGFKPPQTSY